jgi:two-component system chemotaxis sensor kinase CheA
MAKEPYKYFLPEARDLVGQLGKGVLELEKGRVRPDAVQGLLRLAHTLKGAARVVKQREVADRAHLIEDALTPFRDSLDSVPVDTISALLRLVDEVNDRIAGLASHAQPGRPAADDRGPTPLAAVTEIDSLLEGVTETRAQMSSLRTAARTIERARDLANMLIKQLAARDSRNGALLPARNAHLTAQELRQLIGGAEHQLTSGVDHLDRELRQVRQAVEQLRLVPAGTMFTALERTVRDAAQELNKRVRFHGGGADVRVEAHVLSAVQRASVQLVRNAVAHGIEPESIREAHSKPSEGLVTITVARRGRRVLFRVEDDGHGVDIEAVRRAAAQRGLVHSDTRTLGAEDLVRMLLRGGISTSPDVTEVAGRGVGLDVVREVAEALGGDVTVVTTPGKGTAFELVVPVSLASVETLVVEAGAALAAIPLDSIRQTLGVAAAEISRSSHGESIVHGGRLIPFLPLARALRGESATRRSGLQHTIVVKGTKGIAAIGVDRCVGAERIIVRPLPGLAAAEAVVAGMYLDAEGNPQMVLDPDALVEEAMREDAFDTVSEPAHRSPLLVIDDSLTTRMLEQSILESAGYEVEAVTSAEEALANARRKSYALFLVDVEMPGMDGFTFIERVRADPALSTVPALLVTSRDSAEDRQRGQDVGAQGYLVKSEFNQADLLARIKHLVG